MHPDLGQHRVILDLTLTQRRTIVRDQHELGLSLTQRLEALLVPEGVSTRSRDDGQARVDALGRFFRALLGSHDACVRSRLLKNVKVVRAVRTRVPRVRECEAAEVSRWMILCAWGEGTHSRVTTLHLEMDRGWRVDGARAGLGASIYRVWGMHGS